MDKDEKRPGIPGDESATTGEQSTIEPEAAKAAQGPEPAASPPPAATTARRTNVLLIALIAVSCVAVLLLASTVILAATGDFGHRGRFDRPCGPLMRMREGGPMGDVHQWRRQGQNRQGQQDQQQSAPQEQQGGQQQQQQSAPQQ